MGPGRHGPHEFGGGAVDAPSGQVGDGLDLAGVGTERLEEVENVLRRQHEGDAEVLRQVVHEVDQRRAGLGVDPFQVGGQLGVSQRPHADFQQGDRHLPAGGQDLEETLQGGVGHHGNVLSGG